MKLHQKRLLDKGKIEKLVGVLRAIPSRNPELTEKIRLEADYFARNAERMALPPVPPSAPFRRLRRHRSRMQNRGRFPPQTRGNVLDRPGSQRHPRPPLHLSQWPL